MKLAVVTVILLATLGGCPGSDGGPDWRAETDRLRTENEKLTARLSEQEAAIQRLQTQVANLSKLGPDRFARLLTVQKIELAGLTGGYDDDRRPGDDGVRVLIQPFDQDGELLKAAGDITVQLFDLANPQGQEKIGDYKFTAEEARKVWHGRLATGHYTLKCPWQKGPPAHPDLTVKVEFVELLTGKSLTAQKLCQVKLAPGAATRESD